MGDSRSSGERLANDDILPSARNETLSGEQAQLAQLVLLGGDCLQKRGERSLGKEARLLAKCQTWAR